MAEERLLNTPPMAGATHVIGTTWMGSIEAELPSTHHVDSVQERKVNDGPHDSGPHEMRGKEGGLTHRLEANCNTPLCLNP